MESIIVTLMLLIGCILVGSVIIFGITAQARGAQSKPSSCVINITTNACAR